MKKTLSLILALMFCFSIVACSAPVEEPLPTPAPTTAPTPEPTAEPTPEPSEAPEGEIVTGDVNLLTGLELQNEEAIGKRPVAVMVNNSSSSLPQYGVGEADIIVETLVEGGITRLMAIYGDYTQVPDVSAVRSCRFYYPAISESFDAIYTHWGADEITARPLLYTWGIDNIDGIAGQYDLFARDQERLNMGYALEEASVFYGTKLVEALEENDHRTDLEDDKQETAFSFLTSATAPEGEEASEVTVDFEGGMDYYSDFTYNEEEEVYYKDHNGKAHIDGISEENLTFTNLLIFETEIGYMSDGNRRDMDVTGENKSGYYISQGVAQKITWTKDGIEGKIELFDESGNPLNINSGKSYIAYCESGDVTFT